jgi:hypothetical protein
MKTGAITKNGCISGSKEIESYSNKKCSVDLFGAETEASLSYKRNFFLMGDRIFCCCNRLFAEMTRISALSPQLMLTQIVPKELSKHLQALIKKHTFFAIILHR